MKMGFLGELGIRWGKHRLDEHLSVGEDLIFEVENLDSKMEDLWDTWQDMSGSVSPLNSQEEGKERMRSFVDLTKPTKSIFSLYIFSH